MLSVIEVKTKKQRKEFVEYPLRLYKGNPYFVPPLYGDEMAMFTSKNIYSKTCKSAFYLAQRDGVTVGRIQAIIQNQYNDIYNVKQVRFTRFDCENNPETAKALFDAAEAWAKANGMDTVVGPLGYSDMEREGLLIEGFDYLSTFEEQYNYEYYASLSTLSTLMTSSFPPCRKNSTTSISAWAITASSAHFLRIKKKNWPRSRSELLPMK